MPSDLVELRRGIKKYAIAYACMRNPMWESLERRYQDKIKQGLLNNMWSNNPGELERWADDGGKGI